MKTSLAAGIGLVMLGLLPSDLLGQAGFERENREAVQHGWLFDYDEAKEAARKTGKPLMVVFRCVP